ncbi:MAG: MFS transporter, partial [Chloroflexota bacterium]
GRVVLGTSADRIGNKQALIMGFVLMTIALFWLVPAREAWMLYFIAAVFGFAFGTGVIVSPLIADLFGLSSHGLILGVISFGYCIGGAIGPFMAGYIFDTTKSYQLAFLVCVGLSISSIILASLLRPIRRVEYHM